MRHHLVTAAAALTLAVGSLLPASAASAVANCLLSGDTITITFAGTSKLELANRDDHVIATDDGTETDCTTATGQATSMLARIALTTPQPFSPADVYLHLGNPFTTTIGASGDASKLVLLDLSTVDRPDGRVQWTPPPRRPISTGQ